MTSVAKVASGVAAASTASAGGIYFGTDLFKSSNLPKKEKVSSLLKTTNPERRLITATELSDSNWKITWKLYRERSKNVEKDIWGLDGWSKPTSDVQLENTIQSFIDACSSKQDLEVVDANDDLYKQVLDFCTRETLVKDLVSETSGKTSLVGTDDSAGWNNAWKAYKDSHSGKDGTDTWTLTDWTTKKEKAEAPQTFKDACSKKLETKTGDKKHVDYVNFIGWCTK
ncbi:hypothetical protein HF1_02790 [Mycoplasma haemofelis str. Langford 1]|uniref:Uncharacterized protein n=1 Tax=Mycoplasma haemofelis (strain Langford 1) TaxID=941640 RepID=E8ZGL6_MYCHL|nr:hypothetical protein [Mycoplasma haemofelis]CBY92287.1 hypothetical protein HF1_02790 [Mycoplasma haemofelis str. Langford 1]